MALIDRELDEGILRAKIEDVVLVDARRNDQQRPLVDLRRRWVVLDELDQLVAKHDLARRHAQVAADFERRFVGHRDAAAASVGDQIGKPLATDAPPDSSASLSASGFVARKLDGETASTY